MEKLSVLEARKLLHGAISASTQKETELQLMVGSRYHELIESADAIVLMHSSAADLRERLYSLPKSAQFLIQANQLKTSSLKNNKVNNEKELSSNDKEDESSSSSSPSSVSNENISMTKDDEYFFRNVLTIPPRIWNALDEHRFYDATSALLEWPSKEDYIDTSNKNGSDEKEEEENENDIKNKYFPISDMKNLPSWFHEFELYMNQFPSKVIKEANKQLQQRQYQTIDYAGGLISLYIINQQNGKNEKFIDVNQLLSTFLDSRSKWISRALDKCNITNSNGLSSSEASSSLNELEWNHKIQKCLRVAVRSIRRTISDVHLLFLGNIPPSSFLNKENEENNDNEDVIFNEEFNMNKSMVLSGITNLLEKKYNLQQNQNQNQKEEGGKNKYSYNLTSIEIKKQVTLWFSNQIKLIIQSSQICLKKNCHTASSLAFIRNLLWKESTQFHILIGREILTNEEKASAFNNDNHDDKTTTNINLSKKNSEMEVMTKKSINNNEFQMIKSFSYSETNNSNKDLNKKTMNQHHEEEEIGVKQWSLSCETCIDTDLLISLLEGASIRSLNVSDKGGDLDKVKSTGLDLWSILYSRIFSELSESLLHESLREILKDTIHKLDLMLDLICNKKTNGTCNDGVLSNNNHSFSLKGCQAYELLTCSEKMMSSFEMKLKQLNQDATSLVQQGDEDAYEDLQNGLYLKSIEMISCFINHLRRKNNTLINKTQKLSSKLEKLNKQKLNIFYEEEKEEEISTQVNNEEEDEETRLLYEIMNYMDGSLFIGRISKLFMNVGHCDTLRLILNNIPKYYSQPHPDRISMEQLHAAFIVTDNNGDGELDSSEVYEAINNVLGCEGKLLILDDEKMPTMTLSEFALFSSCILESGKPYEYLLQCCDSIFISSFSNWSLNISLLLKNHLFYELNQYITSTNTFEMNTSISHISSLKVKSSSFSELSWRCEHGLWIQIEENHENNVENNEGKHENENVTVGKRGSIYLSEKVKGTRTAAMKNMEKEWQNKIGVGNNNNNDENLSIRKPDHGTTAPSLVTPGAVSNGLQRFLFHASTELNRVIGLSDTIEVSISSSNNKDTAVVDSSKQNHQNIFTVIKLMFFKDLMSSLSSIYHEISLNIANLDSCYEGAVYQLICDVRFIISWFQSNLLKREFQEDNQLDNESTSTSGGVNKSLRNSLKEWLRRFNNIERSLSVYVDSNQLQEHVNYMTLATDRFLDEGHIMLDILLSPVKNLNDQTTSVISPNIPSSSSSLTIADVPNNIMHLAPPVRRFSLLPIPMDYIQTHNVENHVSSSSSSNLSSHDPLNKSNMHSEDASNASGGFSLLNNLRFKW